MGAAPEASRLRWYRTHRVYARGRPLVARHFPCSKFEDPPDILPYGRRDTGESSESAQCLGDSLTIMKQLGDEAYAAGLADRNCWQVKTSKRLIYLLRHNKDTNLGRYNDALFENIDKDLQAFPWAPHKILGFLLGNTKSRFTVHVQLRRLDYDDVPSIDWCISLSAVQGHSRVSDVADPSTLGEPLTLDRCRALGYIFHATRNKNWESIKEQGLALGHTREQGQSSRVAIHMVYAGGSEAPRHGTQIQYGKYLFYCNVKFEELLDEGGALFLADNGVVLSYKMIPAKYYTNQSLIDAEFRDEDFITFPKPTPKDKRAKRPSPKDMSDEAYAAAWEDYRAYLHEIEVYREFEYIRKDFQFIVGCFSESYGDELFNYLRVNQDNHELRKRFVLTLDNGDCVFDCSLREPFNSRLIIAKIKKRWDELEMSARNFASHFGRKAFNDLAEYDFV